MKRFNLPIYIPDIVYRPGVQILLLYRRLRYGYPFRKIPLTQGKFAIVDQPDYELLSQYNWILEKDEIRFYAKRRRLASDLGRTGSRIKMHRQIMDFPAGLLVDHINHNGLDNRRANLRLVTAAQNVWNTKKQRRLCASRYKGVTLHKGQWRAVIYRRKKQIHLGYFSDEQAAARAYDAKAKELFGEYACLNFPD
jgi:hypothetical protein